MQQGLAGVLRSAGGMDAGYYVPTLPCAEYLSDMYAAERMHWPARYREPVSPTW